MKIIFGSTSELCIIYSLLIRPKQKAQNELLCTLMTSYILTLDSDDNELFFLQQHQLLQKVHKKGFICDIIKI